MRSELRNVAVIQLDAGNDEKKNCEKVFSFLNEAVSRSAQLIALPELFHFRKQLSSDSLPKHRLSSSFITQFQDFSKKHQVSLLLGSFCEGIPNSKKVYNTSVFIDKTGTIKATYRKIHLFDAVVHGTSIKESISYKPGQEISLVNWGRFNCGLSICYDLRFPELYRLYVNKGAHLLFVPASFTYQTGLKHWVPLLKARAIENQCYILAPNQVGIGAGTLKTYGHSIILDPDGNTLVEAGDSEEGVFMASVDFDYQMSIRKHFPCLTHQKL
jgi:deaminated glutathione amidase